MKNDLIAQILRETPLKTRLQVLNEMKFIDFITELGYREEKSWSDEEEKLLLAIIKWSSEMAEYQIEEMLQWEKDGKPV